MSLQRTDTGKTALSLQEIAEMEQTQDLQKHRMTPQQELHVWNTLHLAEVENALLKETLTTESVKCNGLIRQQNTHVEEQTTAIKEIPRQISRTETRIEMSVDKAVSQMQKESLQANRIKEEIKQTVKSEIMTTANEMRDYEKRKIDENLSEIKKELSSTAKEIEKQKEDMKIQGIWRKIFFWATPVLLFIDTILLIIFMS